jgi:hypothetical protein
MRLDKAQHLESFQLETTLEKMISARSLGNIEPGLPSEGGSVQLNRCVVSLRDWPNVETDKVRRQFSRLASELEDDHSCTPSQSAAVQTPF